MPDELSEEEVRLRQQQDQWAAGMADTARQCHYFYGLLVAEGLPEQAAATIAGHWIAASITNGPIHRLINELKGDPG